MRPKCVLKFYLKKDQNQPHLIYIQGIILAQLKIIRLFLEMKFC